MVGRIAAIYNPVHCETHHEPAGFFGFFECIDSVEVAERLIKAAGGHLRSFQCTHMLGPVSFTTNEEAGLLVEGFEEPPRVMCNYAPPYYANLLAGCACTKTMDLLSYEGVLGHRFPRKYVDVFERVSPKGAIRVRPFNRKRMREEIQIIREVYNGSFQDLWGFVPLSPLEAEAMGKSFTPFSDDDLVWIAEYEDKPVGFILAFPDVNEILKGLNGRLFPFGIFKLLLRRRSMRSVRVLGLGVLPAYRSMGIETLLIRQVHRRIETGGYEGAEFSVVNENNIRMRRILERFGFRLAKRYRIYRVPISDGKREA